MKPPYITRRRRSAADPLKLVVAGLFISERNGSPPPISGGPVEATVALSSSFVVLTLAAADQRRTR